MSAKALTLRQPYASLVAIGAKTIETRSFRTSYRGPLLIHAGKHPLGNGALFVGNASAPGGGWTNVTGEPIAQGQQAMMSAAGLLVCPLGAVVASCQLVDCVPIVSWAPLDGPPAWAAHMIPRDDAEPDTQRMILVRDATVAAECLRDGPLPAEIDATPQLPFGDFTPGRYAWLLEDIKSVQERCPRCWGAKELQEGDEREIGGEIITAWRDCPVCRCAGVCPPVPMRGHQGLFEPTWPA